MNRKLRRDRNAFLVFLAAVPIALLAGLPLAVQKGEAYAAYKAEQQRQAAMNAGAGTTAPQKQVEE